MLVMALVLVTVLALASCGEKVCEHTYDEAITTRPTCTAEGEKTLTCSQCGDSYTESVPATGHNYEQKPTKPTCTTAGIMTYTCECGDTYTEELDAALGHSYISVVTDPTCITDGYTTYTCERCDDSYQGDTVTATGVHNLVTSIAALTDEQKALAPKAIGVEAVACSNCDYSATTENVVYVFMDFNTIPENLDSYTGSDRFEAIDDATLNSDVGRKEALTLIDMQEHLQSAKFQGNGHGFVLTEEGKLRIKGATGYIYDELHMVSVRNCALNKFTLSFDFTIASEPKYAADGSDHSKGKNEGFFAFIDQANVWDYKNPILTLDKNTPNADGTAYELYCQYNQWGHKPASSEPTGYFITIGKEYSIQMMFDYSSEGSASVTILIKEAGSSTDYTPIGNYPVYAYYGHEDSWIYFANGNTFDNFKITAAFGDERIPAAE